VKLTALSVRLNSSGMQTPYRVLIAKPGLDGHDRGAKVVARALRDAGFEVIYTGLHQTPEMIVAAAVQEDVDIVGLSILSGAHVPLVRAVQDLFKKRAIGKPIFVGGIIPPDDAKLLKTEGVAAVFGPGTSTKMIVDEIHKVLAS
jgi:methylmalonyl-CoA mutase C-terminal domain/subunit